MRHPNDFDRIAPYYDSLVKLVFGNALLEASIHFFDGIRRYDRLLVVGGGTGRILPYLDHCEQIDYVEMSTEMIERAKANSLSHVNFIQQDFLELDDDLYDVVLCPFFLDVFGPEKLKAVMNKIEGLLLPGGKLVVTDFTMPSSGLQQLFLNAMLKFFKWTTRLESNKLPDIKALVHTAGFDVIDEAEYYNEWVFSGIYQKRETF
ncbi:MAG: class I SAM-dependent methyltransferase [Cyclobacteriaceae bacterium]